MAASEAVVVTEIALGDRVHFPNSRKAQAVEQILTVGEHVTLVSGDASWMVPNTTEVRRVTEGEG